MQVDAHTRLVVLLGYPVGHSRSPLIHNTAFRRQGLNWIYLALPVRPPDLPAAVAGLRALGCAGANVTIPHKQAVSDLVDELSPQARAVGAVNTLVFRRAGADAPVTLYGDNTDVAGFLEGVLPFADRLRGAPMLIFGAGGAARAVAYALLSTFRPERLTITARRAEQAQALAQALAGHDPDGALAALSFAGAGPAVRASRLLVNATPLGMHPHPEGTPWPHVQDFSPGQVVYDLVYNPERTRLIEAAAARGARTIGGLDMLVAQAAAAYVQWTGRPMPVDAVRAALRR